jgi:hypothetical protein
MRAACNVEKEEDRRTRARSPCRPESPPPFRLSTQHSDPPRFISLARSYVQVAALFDDVVNAGGIDSLLSREGPLML